MTDIISCLNLKHFKIVFLNIVQTAAKKTLAISNRPNLSYAMWRIFCLWRMSIENNTLFNMQIVYIWEFTIVPRIKSTSLEKSSSDHQRSAATNTRQPTISVICSNKTLSTRNTRQSQVGGTHELVLLMSRLVYSPYQKRVIVNGEPINRWTISQKEKKWRWIFFAFFKFACP